VGGKNGGNRQRGTARQSERQGKESGKNDGESQKGKGKEEMGKKVGKGTIGLILKEIGKQKTDAQKKRDLWNLSKSYQPESQTEKKRYFTKGWER